MAAMACSLSLSLANYSVMVHENVTTGAELIRVVASDADSGERGTVTFSLSGPQVNTNNVNNKQRCSIKLINNVSLSDRMGHSPSTPRLVRLPW